MLLQIEITPIMQLLIDEILRDLGNVQHSAEDVILTALDELRIRNREKLDKSRESIRRGCEQLDRGESSTFEEAIARIKNATEKE